MYSHSMKAYRFSSNVLKPYEEIIFFLKTEKSAVVTHIYYIFIIYYILYIF